MVDFFFFCKFIYVLGSSRFYVENCEDALAIVRKKGRPTYFITATCNPEWPEIKEALEYKLNT